jgi:8-oxo-dGTP pyrophosphatase MutT (NUDIX family)
MAEIISREMLSRGDFLSLYRICWRDSQGRKGVWEATQRNYAAPAVLVVAWLQPSDRLLLVRQYRPPAEGDVIEFPAGMLDKDETAGQAALRELLEETGYHGRVLRVYPAAFNTPGLSGDCTHLATVEVDEAEERNRRPVTRHGAGEEISVVPVARADLGGFLASESAQGVLFDSKVVAYLATFC